MSKDRDAYAENQEGGLEQQGEQASPARTRPSFFGNTPIIITGGSLTVESPGADLEDNDDPSANKHRGRFFSLIDPSAAHRIRSVIIRDPGNPDPSKRYQTIKIYPVPPGSRHVEITVNYSDMD